MKTLKQFIVSHSKVLVSLSVVLLFSVIFLSSDSGQAHAVDLSQIPSDILTGMAGFDDNTPYNNTPPPLGPGPDNNNQALNCNIGGTNYAQSEWSWLFVNGQSPAVDGTASTPFTVQAGNQLQLDIEDLTFICHSAVDGDQYFTNNGNPADGGINTQAWENPSTPLNNSSGPSGPTWPNPPGTWLAEETESQFGTPGVVSGPGSIVTGIYGNNPQSIGFQPTTRYWYPSSETSTFNYQAPTTAGNYSVEIQIPVYEANQFNPGLPYNVYQCVQYPYQTITAAQFGNPEAAGCNYTYIDFWVQMNVTPIQVTISGTIYAYNGSGTPQGINGAPVFICNYGWTTANGSGQFSVTMNEGTPFCVTVNNNNIPAGDSAEIYPNDHGPPPGCDVIYYDSQSANLPTSTGVCNPGSNSGYDILVNVYATLACELIANPASFLAGGQVTLNAGVNVAGTEWWYGSAIGSVGGSIKYPPPSASTIPFTMSSSPPSAPPGYTYGYTYTSPRLDTSGTYTINATANAATSHVTPAPCTANGSVTGPPPTFIVYYEPYLRVFGGDVEAGVDSKYISSCYDNIAGIYSYNNGVLGNNNAGAGTTNAALATGGVNGFTSGQYDQPLTIFNPLTFSNYSGPGDPSTPGGYATPPPSEGYCNPPDYYSVAQSEGCINTPSPTINAQTIALGKTLIYCPSSGNVTITGNITYAAGGSVTSTSNNLPQFEIVTKGGDIDIASSVSRLDGTYIAEGGNICDSWNGSKCLITEPTSSDNLANNLDCGTSPSSTRDWLQIDGSFVANSIDFYRSCGTYNYANPTITPPDSEAAEDFEYSPVNWLVTNTNTTPTGGPAVQSVTSLSPVY